jgi:hypothetical protein
MAGAFFPFLRRASKPKMGHLDWSLRIELKMVTTLILILGGVTCGLRRNIFLYGSKEAA